MKNFEMDLSNISNILQADPNKIPVKGNESRMLKVAFDLFRLKDKPEELWQIQSSDDGDFLVRTYLLPDEKENESNWSIQEDKKCANLTVSYKNIPIERIASEKYGAKTPEDVFILQKTLLKKLATDKNFVMKFFNSLHITKKQFLKNAGLLKDLENWLNSKDITDELNEKIIKVVEDEVKKEDEKDEKDFSEKWASLEKYLEKKANK